jgi:hypothetical protein
LDMESPGEAQRLIPATESAGDLPSGWDVAVEDLVWKRTVNLGELSGGEHILRYWADKGETLLEKIEIGKGTGSYLGGRESVRV